MSTKPSVDVILMNSGFKKAAVAFANVYYFNISTQNTKLTSSITEVEKKMDSVENSFREVKGSLRDMKDTLVNMQEIIRGVLQILAKMNAAPKLGPPTSRITLN